MYVLVAVDGELSLQDSDNLRAFAIREEKPGSAATRLAQIASATDDEGTNRGRLGQLESVENLATRLILLGRAPGVGVDHLARRRAGMRRRRWAGSF